MTYLEIMTYDLKVMTYYLKVMTSYLKVKRYFLKTRLIIKIIITFKQLLIFSK